MLTDEYNTAGQKTSPF